MSSKTKKSVTATPATPATPAAPAAPKVNMNSATKKAKATVTAPAPVSESLKTNGTTKKFDAIIEKFVALAASNNLKVPDSWFKSLPKTSRFSTAVPRDPSKPARANTPYNCFCNAHYAANDKAKADGKTDVKSESFTEISARWKVLSETDRAPFIAQAAKDKARHDTEMAQWNLTHPVQPKVKRAAKVDAVEQVEADAPKKKAPRAKKVPVEAATVTA
jgi:hypothetical protein